MTTDQTPPPDDIPFSLGIGEPDEPGITDDHIEQMRREVGYVALTDPNGDAWEKPIPLQQLEVPPFPTEALPPWLREFCYAESVATQTPVDMAAMLSLSAIAVACQRRIQVEINPGWTEPLNLYVATVLPPANRKSQVFADITAPIARFEAERSQQLAPEIVRVETERAILEQRLVEAKRNAAKAKHDDREASKIEAQEIAQELADRKMPVPPQFIADDVTPEALAKLLCEQGGRIGVMSPEGGGPFAMMRGRYSKNGAANFEVFLKAHGGDTLRVSRIGREANHVERPALTLGLALQPGVINGLADEPTLRSQGLLARFLYVMPKTTIGRRDCDPPPLKAETRSTYDQAISGLLSGQESLTLSLSTGAKKELVAFAQEIEPRLAMGGDLHFISDWAGKLAGTVVRIAALLHIGSLAHNTHNTHNSNSAYCAYSASKGLITDLNITSLSFSVLVGRYLLAHAKAAFSLMGSGEVVSDAQYLLDWLVSTRTTSITKRDAFNGTRGRFREVRNIEPALEKLAEHGYLRQVDSPTRKGPGRKPSPTYSVHPDTLDYYAQYAE